MATDIFDPTTFDVDTDLLAEGWERWSGGSLTVVSGTSPIGDRYARRAHSTSNRMHVSVWTGGPSTTDRMQVRALVRRPILTLVAGAVSRAVVALDGGEAEGNNAYGHVLRNNDEHTRLYAIVDGTNHSPSDIATELHGFTIGADVWYWVLADVDGSTIRHKVWPDGETEPASWQIDHTDASLTSGHAGFGNVHLLDSQSEHMDLAWMGVGTDGDAAPEPDPGDPTYALTTNITGNGTVDRDPDAAEYEESAEVVLTPVPDNENWAFSHWTGDGITGANEEDDPLTYTMPGSAASVTAVFIEVVPLDTPVVTIDAQSNPTTVGGTDGTADASWPAITGAATYRVEIADGLNATEGFTVLEEDHATTSYQATGLGDGEYTLGVTAKP